MITVLHLITGLSAHGAETMLYKLVARSDRGRFRHVVVSLTNVGTLGERLTALGVPLYTLGMRRGLPNPAAALRFLTLLRRVSPDVVQTWLYHADLLGLLSLLVRRGRVPVVWNIRSSYHPGLKSAVAKLCARLSALPTVVVVNSEAGRAIHADLGYHPRRWELIPNGFDLQTLAPDAAARESVRRELGLPGDARLIGLVARLDPQKDHRTFVQAAGILSRRRPEVHFLLVGQGITLKNTTLRQIIEAEGLLGKVHLLGERQDIHRLNAALDIASLSSVYGEGFPNVVGEAMACGVPCVVTDVGDSATIVGDTGRVVPLRDPHALAAAWQELLELGAEEGLALQRRARERIETFFSLDRIVRQYEEMYARLAA